MDTMETIILTSIVNIIITGLVGGIVIYRIQKKIDATIQKSLFEHQIKFTQIHAKRVETLEGVYQRFLVFADTIHESIRETREKDFTEKDALTRSHYVVSKQEDLHEKINDFWHYSAVNRLYLTESIIDEITKILHEAVSLQTLVAMFTGTPDNRSRPLPMWWVDGLIEWRNLEIDKNDVVTPELLLSQLSKELDKQTRTLERLYKSVADTEH